MGRVMLAMLISLNANAIDFRELDKQYHFTAGCGIQKVTQYVAKKNDMPNPAAVGWFVGTSVGILKEVVDANSTSHTADVNDVTATMIGATFCSTF